MRDATQPSLADMLRDVQATASTDVFGWMKLSEDAPSSRLSVADRLKCIRAAMQDGESQAASIRALYPDADPAGLARALGVELELVWQDHRYGDVLHFADYGARPPHIRLYCPAIERINRHLAQASIGQLFGLQDAAPVFIAHELYHHLDMARTRPLAQCHRVQVLNLGPWRLTHGLPSLSEIGANAFAHRLLNLGTRPELLDLIAQFDIQPAVAWAQVQRMREATDALVHHSFQLLERRTPGSMPTAGAA